MNLYTVKDSVAEEFGPLFQAKNDGVATRMFLELLKQTKQPFEYKLFMVGQFDHDTGLIDPVSPEPVVLSLVEEELIISKEDLK